MQLLLVIAHLCSNNLDCQQYYINCLDTKYATFYETRTAELALRECILEKEE